MTQYVIQSTLITNVSSLAVSLSNNDNVIFIRGTVLKPYCTDLVSKRTWREVTIRAVNRETRDVRAPPTSPTHISFCLLSAVPVGGV